MRITNGHAFFGSRYCSLRLAKKRDGGGEEEEEERDSARLKVCVHPVPPSWRHASILERDSLVPLMLGQHHESHL